MAQAPARPTSPHLTIWRWTASMATSILNRATAIALYSGTVLLALWIVLAALGPQAYAPFAALMRSPLGLLALFGYAWSFSFHLLAGTRYLYFDTGRGLHPKTANRTSWAIIVGSFVLAAGIVAAAMLHRN